MANEQFLIVSKPCKLTLTDHQFDLKSTEDESSAKVALVDVAGVLLDTAQVTITASVLRAAAQNNISFIVSAENHMPAGILVGYSSTSTLASRHRAQALLPERLKNGLWGKVIHAKILMQLESLLKSSANAPAARFERLAASALKEKASVFEAQAAKLYWRHLFGESFRREKQGSLDSVNIALNFGYAILRSATARYIALSGLSPVFGIAHENHENPFCLVDDLMEPFRPLVDDLVRRTDLVGAEFGTPQKQKILSILLQYECELSGKRFRVTSAIEESVRSFVRCLEFQDEKQMVLPRRFCSPSL